MKIDLDEYDMPAELPEQLELGEQIAQQMDTLWQKSVQDIDKGVVREHAATLVKGQGGEMTFPEAMYAANLDMCEKYGIAMYRGRRGILREVYRP